MTTLKVSTAIDSPPLTSSSPAGRQCSRTKLIIATALGNGLEMFDFTIYSFFAVLIGKLYFPTGSAISSLLLAVATFGVGFLVRPLGGILIGNYADRVGRKAALTLTITLMALGTAVIGLAPTYAQIGIFAPMLIVAGRLLQGFSAGGEMGAATTLLMESGKDSERGFLVGWQPASQGCAALLGALSGFMLTSTLSVEALESWGWRVPFLCGLIIGPVGMYIRRAVHETHDVAPRKQSAFREVISKYRREVILCILMMVNGTASMYIAVFYMPTYLIQFLHMPSHYAFLVGCVAGIVLMVISPLAGILADRVATRKKVIVWATILGAIIIYPAFWTLGHTSNIGVALAVVAVLVSCQALGSSAGYILQMGSFPKHVRVTGLSMSYGIGVAIFGGFAQFIVTWLIDTTGNPMSPAWYMMACSAITLVALALMKEGRGD